MGYKYKVAVVCKTYNHEKYITEAIESFLIQKTDFDVQIIVHDDASTDSTAMIIREYEQKFPDKIFPIYQTENQYSQGVDGKDRVHEQVVSQIDAEYVALCEGDDYWIEPLKLQIQADFMDDNPRYAGTSHSALVIDAISGKKLRNQRLSKKDLTLTCDDMIVGGGGIVPTASILTKSYIYEVRLPFGKELRNFIGDYQLQVYISTYGDFFNFTKFMSVYRANVQNSATHKKRNLDYSSRIKFFESALIFLDELDLYSNRAYSNSINIKKTIILLDLIAFNDVNKIYKFSSITGFPVELSTTMILLLSKLSMRKGFTDSKNILARLLRLFGNISIVFYLLLVQKFSLLFTR